MRIWDVPPEELCDRHLLGEHRELHGLWNILLLGKKGYSQHPETLRWVGKEGALRGRHSDIVTEMAIRGMKHKSPLPGAYSTRVIMSQQEQNTYLHTREEQRRILAAKPCSCYRKES